METIRLPNTVCTATRTLLCLRREADSGVIVSRVKHEGVLRKNFILLAYDKIQNPIQNFQKAVDGCHTSHRDVSKQGILWFSHSRIRLFAGSMDSSTRLPCSSPPPDFAQAHLIEWEKPSSRLVLCHPFFLLPAGLFQRASSWHQGASTGASASVFSVNISVRID